MARSQELFGGHCESWSVPTHSAEEHLALLEFESETSEMEKSQDPLTLSQVSDTKSVEVRADGIFETTSNQLEGRPLSRPAPHANLVSEKVGNTHDSPVAEKLDAPPGDLSATEVSETSTPAAAAFDDQDHERQATSTDETNSASSESANPSASSSNFEHVPVDDGLSRASPSPPTSSYSAFDDADDPSEATAVASHDSEGTSEACSMDETLLKMQHYLIDKVRKTRQIASKRAKLSTPHHLCLNRRSRRTS